jgi:hypothetical protein
LVEDEARFYPEGIALEFSHFFSEVLRAFEGL